MAPARRLASAAALGVCAACALLAAASPSPAQPSPTLADIEVVTQLDIPPLPDGYRSTDQGWIRFSYPEAAVSDVQPFIDVSDQARADLAADLGVSVLDAIEVRVAATSAELLALAPAGLPPEWHGRSAAYPKLRLIVIAMRPTVDDERGDGLEVFRHELARVALYDATAGNMGPAWFNEGYGFRASGQSVLSGVRILWDAFVSGHLLRVPQLDDALEEPGHSAALARAQAADLVAFLSEGEEASRFRDLIKRMAEGKAFGQAVSEAYGRQLYQLEQQWLGTLDTRFSYLPAALTAAFLLLVGGVILAHRWRRRARSAALHARRKKLETAEPRRDAVRVTLAHRTPLPTEVMVPPAPDVPRVAHDGRWHTLH